METGLAGKVVLITGAAGGMGHVIGREFAAEGARLALVDLTKPAVPDETPEGEVVALAADLTEPGAPDAIVQAARARFGTIDVLVNCAGVVRLGALEDFTSTDWDLMLDLNLKATFFLSQAVGRVMLDAGGGRIINIASIGGMTATPGNAVYGISKAAVIALSAQFAVEWGPRGITCNAVAPGMMTNLMEGLIRTSQGFDRQANLIPTRRSGTPQDIAKAAIFLASDAARQINGETILVDGGLSKGLFDLYGRMPFPDE
jgi:NAD(P)-dependent dehydrogenase (short-subunit alcohol dehydrogenase family)